MTKRTTRDASPPRFREPPQDQPSHSADNEEWRPTLKLPRSAADMYSDTDEAAGLAWALVAILEPCTDAGLQPPHVKGALEVAYCALERLERLQKDAVLLSNEEQGQMHAYIRAGGAA